jgi:thermolysin
MKLHFVLITLMILTFGLPVAGEDGKSINLAGTSDISMYVETDEGIPQYVVGNLARRTDYANEYATIMAFLELNKKIYKIINPKEELVINRIEKDRSGNQHLRLYQYYNGLRVIGGNLISHFDNEGKLKAVNGFYQSGIDVSTTPVIEPSDASMIAVTDLAGFFGLANPQEPELVLFPWQDEYILCWHLFLLSDDPLGRWEYFVDAKTSEIVFSINRIMASCEVGTGYSVMGDFRNHIDVWYNGTEYEMRDYTRQLNNNIHGHNGQMPDGNYIQTNIAGTEFPGPVASDEDNFWNISSQAQAVDAHVYTGVFYDWLLGEFGRNSYDNNGASMISSVDWTGDVYNAYWTGSQTVYTMAQPGTRSYAACPDIVAHEWSHGITDYGAVLVYTWESGAINEAFSDMMGAAFEFANDTLDSPDWYLGENFYFPSAALMSNPELRERPSYYMGPYWVESENCIPTQSNDFCGVHVNNGVGHKWFYLLSDGDTFRGVTVNGIGVENAIQIAYHANIYYWTPTTDYRDAAIGTYYAALDLDPSGVWANEVINAWRAVEVDFPDAELAFNYPLGNPLTILYQENTVIEVEVSGLVGGTPVPGTAQIHYSIDGGDIITEDIYQVSDNHYQATLPALDCGTTLEYYFSAQEAGGERFYHPDPQMPFGPVVVDELQVCFADDFESDLGWTVYADALAGNWERGVPVSENTNGPESDFDGSGQCYLTGNAEGDSDVDYGSTQLISPAFDLEGTDGTVSFAAWYDNRCYDGQIAGDMLYIWISNDNGSNWTLAEFVGPNPYFEESWQEYQFVVSDIIMPTSQMKLRFEIGDVGLPTCTEAAIDAVEIIRYSCTSYLCGDANGDKGINIGDVVYIGNYVFRESVCSTQPPIGCPPDPYEAGDVNCDGNVNIGDAVYLGNVIFRPGSPEPCAGCP